jgi:hypothetical protein
MCNLYICNVNKLFLQMNFHLRLKQIRAEKGISNRNLTSLVEVHYSQIGR